MAFESKWTEDLKTNIGIIDEQHKVYFKMINELLASSLKGEARSVIGKSIKILSEYVITHFSTEERMMTKYHYPKYDSHRTVHRHFRQEVERMALLFRDNLDPTKNVILKYDYLLVTWFTNHIKEVDKKMSKFLLEKMEEEKSFTSRIKKFFGLGKKR
jgi:hemerythrin-like metal-binding protein